MSIVSPVRDQPGRRRGPSPNAGVPRPARPRSSPASRQRVISRTDRVPLLRSDGFVDARVPGLARGERPLTRTTTPAERAALRCVNGARPQLAVVPRRRRAVGIVVVCSFVLFVLLLGAVAFQTRLAQNQLALDKTERAVREASGRYDILRRQRAQLRSPNRLAVEAERLGMTPAATGELITISGSIVATVLASASGLPSGAFDTRASALDQFGEIKALTGGAP